jgi:cation diffusion facilitator CzcD-associated flavoprotein CzcO
MESPDELDVIIIGAGFAGELDNSTSPRIVRYKLKPIYIYAGICAAVKLRQRFPIATFEVLEKNDLVGGTWAKNIYPGLSCDIPSQVCVTHLP